MYFDEAAEKLGRFADVLRKVPIEIKKNVTDIVIKIGLPILLDCTDRILFLNGPGYVGLYPDETSEWKVSKNDIESLFMRLCGYAVYSHIDELKHGFISVDRKFRVGISAAAVIENGVLRTVRDITSLTVRIPREVIDCARVLLDAGIQPEKGVLIAGEPSSGKTTLLRDFARLIGSKKRTTVLDERFELSADGCDLGICTSVLQGYPKAEGFSHALRCLSPRFIICDEIGECDLPSIHAAFFSGVSIIATVHAGSAEDLHKRTLCRSLAESGAFGYVVLLEGRAAPTKIKKIYEVEELRETYGFVDHHSVRHFNWGCGKHPSEDAYSRTGYIL